ncbi:mucin-5AC-like [Colossoma macropomum]|uniref:mucin-5AC-like n=1 Tax=Colossoma macropomum TaxID=42526 RepID=UPI001864E39A|nr:mucin-5AC-like [Colossoma macropomum]
MTHAATACPPQPFKWSQSPVLPQQVVGVVNCSSGAMTVGWNSSAVGVNYTTVVWSGTGGPVYCNSTEPHCSVEQLDCGKAYNVMVLAAHGTCQSAPSQQITVEQVPCVPTNVSVSRVCGATSVDITWAPSTGAHTYIAIAIDTHGQTSQCVSNGTSCSITNLTCSQVYSMGVIAANDNCSSRLSQTVSLYTDPCAPTSVSGLVNCSSSTASLLWTPSPNALGYIGRLESYGDVRTCNVSTAGCQISGLLCGQRYNFSVSATDGSCASTRTAPIQLDTAPCAPQNVSTVLACDTNSVTVTWSPTAVPQNYMAIAVWNGGTALSCSSQNTSCSIQGLQCGQQYNITVAASNGNCSGPASPVQTIQTAPCIPQNVTGHVTCGSGSLVASWDAAPGANGYIAMLSASGKFPQMCVTGNLSCVFSGLQCASQYSLSVASQNRICNSTNSPVISLSTGPCDPQNVTAILQCSSSVATVMWSASTGANRYTVLAQTDGGQTLAASCSTSSTSCQLASLTCGKTFNITVLAGDATCNSTFQPRAVVVTAPCLPTILSTSLDCATNAALLSWTPVSSAILYIVNATSTNGHESSCVSTNFSCSLTGLQCGQKYSVYATARGEQCDSSPSTSVTVITAPCSPSMVNAYYDCKNNTALIGWNNNNGSILFVALLEGDGYSDSCSTTGTNCSITGLSCGRGYNVTVKAVSSNCNSSYSQPTGIQTVPCATQNVSASWQCANSSAVVVWAPTAGVSLYSVTALGRDGDVKQCNSTTSTCQLSQMHCGQIYNITVTPYTKNCGGVRSAAFSFSTGPCAPTNLSVVLQCQGNLGTASWLPAAGADSYVATATAPDGHTHTCASNTTSCSFTDLHCGETYSVTVVTLTNGCPSDPSVAVAIRTAPCVPVNVSASVDCSTNTGNISWGSAAGAVVYNAKLVAGNGHVAFCSTSGTSCVVMLDCGQNYSAMVVASTDVCNSSLSSSLQFRSAPCLLQNVTAALDCAANQLAVQWQGTFGSDLYTAVATSISGHQASCNASSSSSCSILGLRCGETYNVTVASSSSNCSIPQASVTQIQSVPCKPQNISVDLQCGSNSATVQWGPWGTAQSYSVTAVDTLSGNVTCSSSSSSCVLNGLSCGRTLNVTVVSRNDQCVSKVSSTVELITAPCSPTHVIASLNCTSNYASVSWDAALGVTSYLVSAVGSAGYNTSCNNTNPQCSITGLQCGQNYSIRVAAQRNGCFSPASQDITLSAAPCPSTNLQASMVCSSNVALVSWSLGSGTQLSNVTVQSLQTLQQFSCVSYGSSCNISTLPCGQRYSVTVTGYSQMCSSPSAVSTVLDTAPCAPSGLNVTSTCNSNTTSVAWSPSSSIVAYYIASAEPSSGLTLTCNSSSTSCDISGLICGQTYNVSVTAYGWDCVGSKSLTYTLKTAPCAPQTVQFQLLTCQSGNLSVVWQPTSGALMYRAEAVTFPGHLLSCYSSYTSCVIPALGCGQTYDVSVVAVGDSCNSSRSAIRQASTAPCPPSSVTAVVNCSTNTATVSWNTSSVLGAVYTARAITNVASPSEVECNSTNSSCALTGLHCGTQYNVTVIATKDNCTSAPSAVYSFFTAPCVPTLSDVVLDCSSGSALAVWSGAGSGSGGVNLFSITAVDGQGEQLGCNNTQTPSCTVWGLQCGRTYTFSVTAGGAQCTSTPSNTLQTRTAACPARAIQTTIGCRNNTASVSWSPGDGALSYTATLQSSDGRTYTCNSAATSCDVTNLPCGQTYSITVAAKGQNCSSTNSTGSPVRTAPCVPQNVTASVNCSNNIGTVSWQSSQGAALYFVMANSSNGQSTNCTSASTSCDLSPLACGLTYTVTVMAKDSNCTSACSAPVQLQTAPCVPTLSDVVLDCSSGSALAVWSGAGSGSGGADLYTVSAVDGQGGQLSCNNTQTPSCTVWGLQCGRTYTFRLTASRGQCTSTASNTLQTRTAACPARAIQTTIGCRNNTASVSWSPGDGAVSHSATLQSSDGHTYTCNSAATSCDVTNLPCGQTYSVTVAAKGQNCSSTNSTGSPVKTAPCVPQNVTASVNCSSNNIGTVSWQSSQGAALYFVMANSSNGQSTNCTSASTSCDLSPLACGLTYTVTVMAKDSNCTSACSAPVQLQTAPCVPTLSDVVLDCSSGSALAVWSGAGSGSGGADLYTVSAVDAACPARAIQTTIGCRNNTASVSWSPGDGAVSYSATLQSSDGRTYTCNSAAMSCDVTNLPCGQTYSVTVAAKGQNCSSTNSTGSPVRTAPCVPQNVTASVNCSSNIGTVSWQSSQGAALYFVMANSSNGQSTNCTSASTSCDLSPLACGLTYTVTVMAKDSNCTSPCSAPVQLQTAPCVPTLSDVVLDCSSGSALAVWSGAGSGSGGADLYTVSAVDGQGGQLSCNNTQTPSCTVWGLQCGRTYTFRLTASRGQCTSTASNTLQTRTAACPARAIQTTIGCRNNTASVSWSPGDGAVSYSATLQSSDGRTYTCNSAAMSCDVTNLPCGQTYSVTVAAKGQNCSSTNSTGSPVRTAPCVPQNVTASVNCSSNIGTVSWQSSQGAALYFVMANSSNGQSTNCTSASTSCDLSPLACGLTYTVTVMAKDSNCTSPCSAPVQLQTAPCVPTLSDVVLDCSSGSALAVWSGAGSGSGGADLYTVSAVDGQGGQLSCNNTQTPSCTVWGLQCGRTYTFRLTASRGQCTSTASNTLQTRTAACPAREVQTVIGCYNNTASVSWSPGNGAVLYSAVLQSSDGRTYTCNSTATSCDVTNLPCGQTYSVTVAAKGQNCSSTNSRGSPVRTAPCVPQNVSASVNCSSNIGTVSWQSSQGAALYFVMANSSNGQSTNCTSVSTSCNLSPLACGLTYTVTVMAKDSNCTSACSAPVQLKTVPCVPQNFLPVVDCETNNVNVSWSPSMGASLYTVTLRDANGLSGTCQSTGGQCNATGLRCGQMYYVSVTASDDRCTSAPSTSTTVQSVPCPPSYISAVLNCTTDVAVVMWGPSAGSLGYSVSAVASLGQISRCSSNGSSTSCELSSLRCGAAYTVSVQALGAMCNRSADMSGYLTTEPCVPQHLKVQYDLFIAQLFWDFTQEDTTFTALAATQQSLNITCPETADTNCALSGTQCGQIYNITVTAHNSACNGTGTATSDPYQLMTEPCPPQNVRARMNCSSLVASVSWDTSLVAVGYVVFMDNWNGDSWANVTSQTSYSVPGLSCGTRYTTYVRALGQVYNSSDSDTVSLQTAPCVPDSTSVSVQVDCATDTALLSWAFSAGVDNYTAVVLGSGGHFNSCSTQQNQCNVSLLCGQSYNLTLISINQQCQIPTVINTTFQSTPCEPVGVVVNMACGTSSAVVSWQRAQGVDYYIARAVRGGDGREDVCNSTSSTCQFSSLACGQNYTFTITAYMGRCSSNTSQPAYISTAPCVPSGLVAVSASGCGSAGALLSWNSSAGAEVYVVNGWSRDGHTVSLRTSLSTISLPDLHCSQEYNFTITASNQQCNSTPSLPARLQTGPCSAAAVSAVLDCMSSVAVVSWQPNNGTAIYTATLLDSSGPLRSCVGVDSQCNIGGLACGKNYSVSVTVSNDQCNSTTTLPTSLQTAPCVPVNISVITGCANSSAVVVWDRSQGAISYYVYAVSSNGNISCQSTSPTCVLTNLTCGSTYSVRVVAVGNNCSSVPSQPVVISSVPCQPTNVSVDVQCANGIAMLSWAAQTGAVQYFATAQSDNATPLYCQTTNTSCTLQGLHCGAVYNFTVQASNGPCNSSFSKTLTGGGVPCPPASFRVIPSVLVGQSQLLRAYWSIVNCPNSSYLLEVSGSIQGDPQSLFQMTSYWTNRTYFEMPVPCSSTYSASVRAQNSGGTSVPSAVVTGISVPCPPLSVTFTGSNSSAVVAWNASLYATVYHVYQVTSSGRIQLCNTSQLSCPITNVSSNLIMVTARNAAGESAGTSGVRVIAARRRRDLTQTEIGELTSPQASFTMVTADAVWLEWTHVEGAEFYSLLIREQSSSSKPVVMTVYGETSIIPELKPATMYCISLSARNSYSSGPYSEPACVQTAALS